MSQGLIKISRSEAIKIIEESVGKFFQKLLDKLKTKKTKIVRQNVTKIKVYNTTRAIHYIPKSLQVNMKCGRKSFKKPAKLANTNRNQLSNITNVRKDAQKHPTLSGNDKNNLSISSLDSSGSTLQCGQIIPSNPRRIFTTSKEERRVKTTNNQSSSSGECGVYKFQDKSEFVKSGKRKREVPPMPGNYKRTDIRNYFNKVVFDSQSTQTESEGQADAQPTLLELLDLMDFDEFSQIPGNQEALRLYLSS